MSGGVRCDYQGSLPEWRNTWTRTCTPKISTASAFPQMPPKSSESQLCRFWDARQYKWKQLRLLQLLGLSFHRQVLQAASPKAWAPCTLVPFPTSISITDLFSQTPTATDIYAETESLQIRMWVQSSVLPPCQLTTSPTATLQRGEACLLLIHLAAAEAKN